MTQYRTTRRVFTGAELDAIMTHIPGFYRSVAIDWSHDNDDNLLDSGRVTAHQSEFPKVLAAVRLVCGDARA